MKSLHTYFFRPLQSSSTHVQGQLASSVMPGYSSNYWLSASSFKWIQNSNCHKVRVSLPQPVGQSLQGPTHPGYSHNSNTHNLPVAMFPCVRELACNPRDFPPPSQLSLHLSSSPEKPSWLLSIIAYKLYPVLPVFISYNIEKAPWGQELGLMALLTAYFRHRSKTSHKCLLSEWLFLGCFIMENHCSLGVFICLTRAMAWAPSIKKHFQSSIRPLGEIVVCSGDLKEQLRTQNLPDLHRGNHTSEAGKWAGVSSFYTVNDFPSSTHNPCHSPVPTNHEEQADTQVFTL